MRTSITISCAASPLPALAIAVPAEIGTNSNDLARHEAYRQSARSPEARSGLQPDGGSETLCPDVFRKNGDGGYFAIGVWENKKQAILEIPISTWNHTYDRS
jgi:hypothetical protein